MNSDLISREDLKEDLKRYFTNCEALYQILTIIDNAPTVEYTFEEAFQKTVCEKRLYCPERPQGKWIKWNFKTFGAMGDWEYKCSNCEKVYGGEYNYCPNCGADMRKGVDNEV